MEVLTPRAYEARFQDPAPEGVGIQQIGPEDVRLPERNPRGHKYTFGRALIVAGAEGYSGAPALAANACERSGAGLTRLIVPRSIYPIVAARCDGAVVTPAEADDAGGFSGDAAAALLPHLKTASACVIGPGLGRGSGAGRLIAAALREAACPLVLDADALHYLGAHLWLLDRCAAPVILTPHAGEFRYLGGDLTHGRLAGAHAFAMEHPNVVLILKGAGTLVCHGEETTVNPTGSAALAKGGTGDVLAGILCALLAQGMAPTEAARCAVYLHGLAGDIAAEAVGPYCLAPSDLIAHLPDAFRRVLT